MLYTSYAHGFKSGGFVGRITTPQAIGPFGPEKVDTYEIGAKTDFLDRRLRVDVAGFFTNYRDMQLPEIAYIPNAQGVVLQANTIQNVPRAIIKGVELEATARPVDALTLTLTAASLNATYRDFCYPDTAYHPASGMSDPGCPTTLQGTPAILRNMYGYALQNSPRWNGTAGAAYEFAVAGGKLTAHALYQYTGKKYLSAIDDSPRATIQSTAIPISVSIGRHRTKDGRSACLRTTPSTGDTSRKCSICPASGGGYLRTTTRVRRNSQGEVVTALER